MQLSNRLQAVAALMDQCECLADVGTDHGYIPIYMMQQHRIKRAIAMDVNKGPLKRAEDNIRSYHFEEQIQVRLSDGLVKLSSQEADGVVIAGMGGALTIRILQMGKEALQSVTRMVLQPQSEIHLVRTYLYENGFVIADEDMVFEDGKYYPMMLVQKGSMQKLSDAELYYGPKLIQKKHPVLRDFLKKEENSAKEILSHLKEQSGEKIAARILEMEAQLERIYTTQELIK